MSKFEQENEVRPAVTMEGVESDNDSALGDLWNQIYNERVGGAVAGTSKSVLRAESQEIDHSQHNQLLDGSLGQLAICANPSIVEVESAIGSVGTAVATDSALQSVSSAMSGALEGMGKAVGMAPSRQQSEHPLAAALRSAGKLIAPDEALGSIAREANADVRFPEKVILPYLPAGGIEELLKGAIKGVGTEVRAAELEEAANALSDLLARGKGGAVSSIGREVFLARMADLFFGSKSGIDSVAQQIEQRTALSSVDSQINEGGAVSGIGREVFLARLADLFFGSKSAIDSVAKQIEPRTALSGVGSNINQKAGGGLERLQQLMEKAGKKVQYEPDFKINNIVA